MTLQPLHGTTTTVVEENTETKIVENGFANTIDSTFEQQPSTSFRKPADSAPTDASCFLETLTLIIENFCTILRVSVNALRRSSF